jgi:hypothetical protein
MFVRLSIIHRKHLRPKATEVNGINHLCSSHFTIGNIIFQKCYTPRPCTSTLHKVKRRRIQPPDMEGGKVKFFSCLTKYHTMTPAHEYVLEG